MTAEEWPVVVESDEYPDLAAKPGAWVADALCAQIDPELWYPEKGGSARLPKGVCHTCPVAQDCLDYALATNEQWGVWGGASRSQREAMADGTLPAIVPSWLREDASYAAKAEAEGVDLRALLATFDDEPDEPVDLTHDSDGWPAWADVA